METTFLFMNCPLEYQVHCGLKGAQRIIAPHEESITWCQFKEAYLRKYYPVTARMKLQATLLELK